jgi:ankyrin repeat protein
MLKNIYRFQDSNDNNLLHILINNNKSKYLDKILEKGLKYGYIKNIINKQNNEGDTPLHLAVKSKNYTVASTLINYGANKNIINCQGQKIIMKGGAKNIYHGKRYI